MARDRLDTLAALRVVAEHGSFTRAAAELGVTQSALSHAIRRLEDDIGQRLLSRTTRSVAPTAVGEALLTRLGPALDEISMALSQVAAGADQPSGLLRLTMGRDAAELLVLPMLPAFRAAHPGIQIEITATDALEDLVKGRFDAGIRMGDQLEQDMIARHLTKETLPVVVAAPDYLEHAGRPTRPQDLERHACLGYRMHSAGRVMPWRFTGPKGDVIFRDATAMVFNEGTLLRQAAIRAMGLTYLWHHMVAEDLDAGRLESVLGDHIEPLPGFYLYYPSRQGSPTLSLFAEALVDWCRRHSPQ